MIERSLVLIKPDGVKRGLTGAIFKRLEDAGLKIVALKMMCIDKEFAKKHYTYEDIGLKHGEKIRDILIDFITESPVVAAVFEGVDAVEVIRKLCGSTEPRTAAPGTIRGDFSHHSYEYCNEKGMAIKNVIHASSDKESADREVKLWFKTAEIHSYKRVDEEYHY